MKNSMKVAERMDISNQVVSQTTLDGDQALGGSVTNRDSVIDEDSVATTPVTQSIKFKEKSNPSVGDSDYHVETEQISEAVARCGKKLVPGSVLRKVILQGSVQLESPLLIGSGESDDLTDILVLKNKEDRPYIPGTSLAGVLRSQAETADVYFGELDKNQSCIAVSDIMLENASLVIRDGVRIDPVLGTAVDGAKYDYEAVDRGAKGEIYLEATIRLDQYEKMTAIETYMYRLGQLVLQGIFVGAHTAKGFGKLQGVSGTIKLLVYDFSKQADVEAWLEQETPAKYVLVSGTPAPNKEDFVLEGEFLLDSSLLVRSNNPEAQEMIKKALGVDDATTIAAVPLLSGGEFVIPGSSVKGVLRNQALKIFQVLGKAEVALDDLMGYSKEDTNAKKKSRLQVEEVYIKKNNGVKPYPQTRNKIDRFTGATVESALFTNIPLWQTSKTQSTVTLRLRIAKCQDWEAGLMLFLLKDLWTGQVAFGGEKSIGRGVLKGQQATIKFANQKYEIVDNGAFQVMGNKEALEAYAEAFMNMQSAGEAR